MRNAVLNGIPKPTGGFEAAGNIGVDEPLFGLRHSGLLLCFVEWIVQAIDFVEIGFCQNPQSPGEVLSEWKPGQSQWASPAFLGTDLRFGNDQ